MPQSLLLKDRTIVITGGATGIGKSYSRAIAAQGANVVIADLDGDLSKSFADELCKSGAVASGIGVNLLEAANLVALAELIADEFGALHGLVNNAAIMSSLPRRSWLDIPVEEWEMVMDVNLRGLFMVTRFLYPLMRVGGGSIVNIASTRAFDGTPNRLHYTTSKAGVIGFTRALAREVGVDRVRVNAIAPGITLSETQIASSNPAYLQKLAEGRALPHHQTPDDLVGAVLFLLSDGSTAMSGQTLVVDGGRVMH